MLIAFCWELLQYCCIKKTCNESYKLDLEEENGLQIIGFCLQKNPTIQPWQHVTKESNHPTMATCYKRIQPWYHVTWAKTSTLVNWWSHKPVTNLLREGVHGFFCYIGK
jgi:hypothetical protein